MELDEFFLLLRKAEMHETVDSEMDLTVGGVATSPSGGRKEKKKKNVVLIVFLNFLLFSSRFWLFLFACFPVAFGGFLAL